MYPALKLTVAHMRVCVHQFRTGLFASLRPLTSFGQRVAPFGNRGGAFRRPSQILQNCDSSQESQSSRTKWLSDKMESYPSAFPSPTTKFHLDGPIRFTLLDFRPTYRRWITLYLEILNDYYLNQKNCLKVIIRL